MFTANECGLKTHYISGQTREERKQHALFHLYPSLPVSVYISYSLSLRNLRRVSSGTTPSSVGLQLVKQRHLITAEATQSYVCLLGVLKAFVSKLSGLCPLQ